MILLLKTKMKLKITGDRDSLKLLRKAATEKMSIENNNYQYVEKNYQYMKRKVERAEEQLTILKSERSILNRKLKKGKIKKKKYLSQINSIDLEMSEPKQVLSNYKQKMIKTEYYLKYNSPVYCYYNIDKEIDEDYTDLGHYEQIKTILKENKIAFKTKETFKYPKIKLMEKLFNRDYQKEVIRTILEKKMGIIYFPTGSGKTRIALYTILHLYKYIMKREKRILFLVEQQDLILQTKGAFKKLEKKMDITLLGGGHHHPEGDLVIATVQTLGSLYKREKKDFKDWAQSFQLIIIDETDMFTTDNRINIIKQFRNTKWRIFLSATPFSRFKPMEAIKLTGVSCGVIHTVKEASLIKNGFLSEQKAFFIESYHTSYHNRFYGRNKWQAIYKQLIVNNKWRNNLIYKIYKVLEQQDLRALFIVENLEHGENLLKLFKDVKFYSGADDSFERKKAIKNIEKGKRKIIITTRIFRRAIDIPSLQVVVNCAGGKSDNSVTQTKGRVGRLKSQTDKTKNKALYIDIFDYGNKFLESHSNERRETLKLLDLPLENIYIDNLEQGVKKFFN